MGTGNVGNHGNRRMHQRRGPGNFARRVGAQLKDTEAVLIIESQQGKWHTDIVVQVALGRQHLVTQHAGNHFLHGGLSGITGHGNAHHIKLVSPGGSHLA